MLFSGVDKMKNSVKILIKDIYHNSDITLMQENVFRSRNNKETKFSLCIQSSV